MIWRPLGEINYGHSFGNITPAEAVLLWQYTHKLFASHGVTECPCGCSTSDAGDKHDRRLELLQQAATITPAARLLDIVSLDSYPPDAEALGHGYV